ncbi:MAG: 3-hydroxyacyl-CoA dehydrogenase family protein [Chloroflexi bacterium]|nr:3-hydroxyacyl-CoA dehydrogenase family protein [Chloroflexota bacterium]
MKLEDIKCIGVMGGGTMGGGISQALTLAGYKVICRDLNDDLLAKTKDTITDGRFGLKGGVARGKQTQEQMDQALAKLTLTTKVEDLKNCDMVIEAVPDDKDLKKKVFAELDKIVKKGAIFASNTSYITIADLAAVTKRKELFIGMHWFNPAPIMRLVEVIYTPDSSDETVKAGEGVCKRAGKTTVRVKDHWGDTGFIVNRIFRAARIEAWKIVEEGTATGEDINTAMTLGRNWPDGPWDGHRRPKIIDERIDAGGPAYI